ncbi:chorismate mutase [Thermocatellispora tengchongensis]|uniref:chorismate mutase n=1 Tax=Thermocatellispora tengchongensis TaxID=1073253 RepID=UPI00362DEEC2
MAGHRPRVRGRGQRPAGAVRDRRARARREHGARPRADARRQGALRPPRAGRAGRGRRAGRRRGRGGRGRPGARPRRRRPHRRGGPPYGDAGARGHRALDGPSRPGSVAAARAEIDRVDAALATLLERRAELAGVVQRLKPVGGFAGRDMERERRLVAAMARHAPRLGEARLAAIMNAVIEAGLDLSEEERRASP